MSTEESGYGEYTPDEYDFVDDSWTEPKGPFLSDAVFRKLRIFVEILLPAVSTLYFTLAQIWGFPNPEKVVGSIAAITTFLGLILRSARKSYNKSDAKYDGHLNVVEEDGKKVFSLDLMSDPEKLADKKDILFKVQ
jgi:hypothetical protein